MLVTLRVFKGLTGYRGATLNGSLLHRCEVEKNTVLRETLHEPSSCLCCSGFGHSWPGCGP